MRWQDAMGDKCTMNRVGLTRSQFPGENIKKGRDGTSAGKHVTTDTGGAKLNEDMQGKTKSEASKRHDDDYDTILGHQPDKKKNDKQLKECGFLLK